MTPWVSDCPGRKVCSLVQIFGNLQCSACCLDYHGVHSDVSYGHGNGSTKDGIRQDRFLSDIHLVPPQEGSI